MIPSEQQIREFLPSPLKKTGVHLMCTCFVCNKELHCYYNVKTGLWDCKKCKADGNIFTFLKGWGKLYLLEGEQVVFGDLKKISDKLNKEKEIDLEIPNFRLPMGFKKLDFNNEKDPYVRYLKSRKYNRSDFENYKPGKTSLIEKFSDYVIVPIYRDFSVKGFVARYIKEDDEKPRYQNAKNVQFTKLLDGIDNVTSNTHTAIIIEGHFDKISVNSELKLNETDEFCALSTFGKKISEYQIALLRQTNIKDIYLLYDFSDAIDQIKKFGLALHQYFNVKGCFANITKDPGKMNGLEIVDILQSAQPIKSYIYDKVQPNNLH